MPPAYVKTVREEIYYEYAKLISRSAHLSKPPVDPSRFLSRGSRDKEGAE
jgi:hypothetical protein